ncbi:MAG: acyltransferase family protein [Lachnospiraceae bacterium]|nr:acyltransferase family protein [Lachnospiraceae bacterium]
MSMNENLISKTEKGSANRRIVYLDFIRVIACILVVMVHISAQQIEDFSVDSVQFIITNSFNCLAFTGVALFVMISGALALNPQKEVGIKSMLMHKTMHFFILYYIWKAFYQVVDLLDKGACFTFQNIKNDIILALIQKHGYYHLWFLPMIAILYMIVPIVKKSVAEKNVCMYFLCVFFVTALLVPTMFNFEFKFKYLVVDFFAANDFYLFGGYLGYFILGHSLHSWGGKLTKGMRIMLYGMGLVSFLLAVILGALHAQSAGHPTYIMNTPFAATTFFIAAAIFVNIQAIGEKTDSLWKAEKVLTFGAGTTFGIYLLHPLIILLLSKIGVKTALCTPLLSIPLLTIGTILLCVPVTVLWSKVPFLRKLIQ